MTAKGYRPASNHDDHHLRQPSMIGRPAVRAVGRARIGRAGCVATETVQLSDGAIFDLRVTPVGKQIGNETVNGDPDLNLTACAGKVVRLLPGQHREHPGVHCRDHRDSNSAASSRYEHDQFVRSVMLAPFERVVIDVQLTELGQLEHHTPGQGVPAWPGSPSPQNMSQKDESPFRRNASRAGFPSGPARTVTVVRVERRALGFQALLPSRGRGVVDGW